MRVQYRLAALASCLACPVFAQQGSPYRDVLLRIRDSLTVVEASVGDFNRDISGVGTQTVTIRAESLRKRCEAVTSTLAVARVQFRPAAEGRARRQFVEIGQAMARLQERITTECVIGFRPNGPGNRADTLRAWGAHRGSEITKAIRSYERSANAFAGASGFKLEPRMPTR